MVDHVQLILDEIGKVNANVLILGDRMAGVEKRLSAVDQRLDGVEKHLTVVDEHLDRMGKRLDGTEDSVKGLNKRLSDVQITLDEVTNRNITIIAEGHLDLTRKLDEALRVENEKEIMRIRLNLLADDVRKLKERNGEPA